MDNTHPGNLQCFLDVYREELERSYKASPESYAWPWSDFDVVFSRMAKGIEAGSFNKDNETFKRTCKRLRIKHTYTAIREFISR